MSTETRSMWLLQSLVAPIRARGWKAPEPSEISRSSVETVEHDGERLHFVVDQELTRRLLADRSLRASPQPVGLKETCRYFGLDDSLPTEFFARTPVFLEGDSHREARRRFSRQARLAMRAMQPELDGLTDAHFATLCRAESGVGLATVGAAQFVDRVLYRLFEHLLPGSQKHYSELAGHPQSLFELVHHPRRLRETLDAMMVFLQEYRGDAEAYETAWVLMSFVLMGRDPLVGGIADFLHLWRDQSETERDKWLVEMQARDVFRYTRPVNLISRVATCRLDEPGLEVRAGDLVVFMLMARDPATSGCPGARDDLAFGYGAHLCVGMPLSLEITQAWMEGLERWGKKIPWEQFQAEQPVPSVFRRYRAASLGTP